MSLRDGWFGWSITLPRRRFQTKPMKAAMLLNDGSGTRDF
jgi:hypothetical protein